MTTILSMTKTVLAGMVAIWCLLGVTACHGSPSSQLPHPTFDPNAARAKAAQEREVNDLLPRCRLLGEFIDGGQPKGLTKAVPLDVSDHRFVFTVHVVRMLEGVPLSGMEQEMVFAVHSPAMFFRRQGIRLRRGTYYPAGRYVMTLWASPDGGTLDLEVVAADDRVMP